ncbi:uncharacterized protein LOC143269009 [Peromyscus maniculatus bairdii]|uniref:uncharacterized protein LOC143269009 n=1 Tax=Peromyscus maniculatus bairdii TaxID=230844 RepID=UPI003FCFC68D
MVLILLPHPRPGRLVQMDLGSEDDSRGTREPTPQTRGKKAFWVRSQRFRRTHSWSRDLFCPGGRGPGRAGCRQIPPPEKEQFPESSKSPGPSSHRYLIVV